MMTRGAHRPLIWLVIAVLIAACGTTGLTVATPTVAPTQAPAIATTAPPTPAPATARPTVSPKPTIKPKPTLRPAQLAFGTLNYTASGCWSSNYTDAEGHGISGVMVDFKVTAKNTGQVKSQLLPIRIETTDWFTTSPILFKHSWPDVTYSNADKSADIVGPAILPGKSRTLSWSMLLQTPFDIHYTLDIADGHWSMWTSNQVCF